MNLLQGIKRHSQGRTALICMVIPALILVFIFAYAPIWGWSMAFVDYSPGVPIGESNFVGFKYFARMLSSKDFWRVIKNTLGLSSLKILITPLPVIFAILLGEIGGKRFKKSIQTVAAFPHFVSWIVVYAVFTSLFAPDDGIINIALKQLGLIEQGMSIITNPNTSWIVMTLVELWKTAGYTAIIYIAAIAGIDTELYQAADVDGAGRFQKIWYITVPGIATTFTVMLILSIGNILNAGFDQYYTFMNPLIQESLEVIDVYTYRIGISNMDFSFATAVGIFKSVVGVGLFAFANSVYKKVNGYSII